MKIDLMFKDQLNIDDAHDERGRAVEVCILNSAGDDIYCIYLDKTRSEQLINHLQKVFGL